MKIQPQYQNILAGIIIFFSAIILRCFYYFFLKEQYFFFDHPSTDVTYFQNWARDIAAGNWLGEKTFYGLPLFAYFLAILYRLTLFQFQLIPFILMAIGAANCVLTFLITQKLFSKKTAWICTLLSIINFTLLHYDTANFPVNLAIFLNLSIVWIFINQSNIKFLYEWFLLGILIGLGTLIDSKLIIFTGLFILYEIVIFKCSSSWMKQRLLIIAGIFLIIFSVGLRNKIVGGSWIWITAQSGLSFYVGNNETATGIYSNPSFIRPDHQGQDEDQIIIAEQLSGKKLNDQEVSQFWRNKGLEFIQQNPKKYIQLLKSKFVCFFTDDEQSWDIDLILQRSWKYHWDINPFWMMCPLAVLGIIFSLTQKPHHNIYLLLLILSQLIFTLIFFLTNRHRTVVLPIMLIYEAFFLNWLIEQWKEKRFSYLITTIILTIFTFQFFPKIKTLNTRDFQFLNASKSAPIYVSKGDYTTAENLYKQALAIQPDDTNTLYNLGSLYASKKEYVKAIAIFEHILKKQPFQVDAMYNMAHCLNVTGKTEEALNLFTQVNELQPQSIDVKVQILNIYLKLKNFTQAQNISSEIIQLNPLLKTQIQSLLQSCQL